MTLMMKRTHHVGTRVDYFGVQVGADNPDSSKVEITFVEENGDSITTWYPRPGKGRLSGRWFDEELVNVTSEVDRTGPPEAAGPTVQRSK